MIHKLLCNILMKCVNKIKKTYQTDDIESLILEICNQYEISNKLYYSGSI